MTDLKPVNADTRLSGRREDIGGSSGSPQMYALKDHDGDGYCLG